MTLTRLSFVDIRPRSIRVPIEFATPEIVMKTSIFSLVQIVLFMFLFCGASAADITDFNTWTLVEDPAHPNFGSSVDTAAQVTLTANGGPVPTGTDIGFSSVNGSTPSTSNQGYYFDPANDFSIAVDFAMDFTNANGTLAFGFGIGEDANGSNSVGVTLVTNNGTPLAFGASARVNDVNLTPATIGLPAQAAARLIVSYDSGSGDVTLGVSNNGDDIAEGSFTYAGLQNSWTDGPLLTSFFIRSDDLLANPWQSGVSNTVVTNFHVISGTPIAAVPEPNSVMALFGLMLLGVSRRRR